jgi:hypothetical protein
VNGRRVGLFCIGLSTLLPSCVYVPRATPVFDPQCRVAAKHMVLQDVQLAAIEHCANEGCVLLVLAASVASAASPWGLTSRPQREA